jgi:hypothetical protein
VEQLKWLDAGPGTGNESVSDIFKFTYISAADAIFEGVYSPEVILANPQNFCFTDEVTQSI